MTLQNYPNNPSKISRDCFPNTRTPSTVREKRHENQKKKKHKRATQNSILHRPSHARLHLFRAIPETHQDNVLLAPRLLAWVCVFVCLCIRDGGAGTPRKNNIPYLSTREKEGWKSQQLVAHQRRGGGPGGGGGERKGQGKGVRQYIHVDECL